VGDDHAGHRLEQRLDDATSLRNAVWSGGSIITSGGLSARPIVSSSSYSTVSPWAEEYVAVSIAAAITSAWRLST
jgi:hypothetical protein